MEKSKKITLLVLFILIFSTFNLKTASAVLTVPEKLIYEARLLDSTGQNPISTDHTFRFSFWVQSPVDVGDVDGVGTINTLAVNYGGWQEVQTVTPNNFGFISFELGTISPLPEIDFTQHLYLQVEVKGSGQPDTAYEILDREPTNPLTDRAPVGSVPYALNADMIDNAELGTSTGDLVILEAGDQFPISVIPGGTNENYFIIDNDDSSITSIDLQFGNTLGKVLSWDMVNGFFNFNDNVNIAGDLTLTGTVDGYDVSDLGDSVNNHLDGGASKHDAFEIDVEAIDGHFYIAGDLETAIDDIDEAIFGISAGVTDRIIVLNSQYDGASYVDDGTNNIGRLYIDNDNTAKENYYEWISKPNNLQDYDIVIQVTVPKTFVQWDPTTPWNFNYRSSSADPNISKADIFVFDTTGAPVTLVGVSTGLANTNWSQTNLNYSGTPTFTPGDSFIIRIRLYSKNSSTMNLGEIQLNYKG